MMTAEQTTALRNDLQSIIKQERQQAIAARDARMYMLGDKDLKMKLTQMGHKAHTVPHHRRALRISASRERLRQYRSYDKKGTT